MCCSFLVYFDTIIVGSSRESECESAEKKGLRDSAREDKVVKEEKGKRHDDAVSGRARVEIIPYRKCLEGR